MKKITKIILAIIVVAVIALITALVIIGRKQTTTKTTTTATKPTAVTQPAQPIKYPADKPMIADNTIYFISKNQLRTYDLATKKDGIFDFPAHEDVFEIGSLVPVTAQSQFVVLRLDNLNDSGKQFAVFDLTKAEITTKFVDRMKAVAWQADQQKLLAYALSSTNEPYFLTTSLDAKDQKAIIKTKDTDVQPLILTDKALIYATGATIKKIDLEKKQESTLVENTKKVAVAADGSAIAYTTDKGLFSLTKSGIQTISVSRTLPSFFSWSGQYLMFGNPVTKTVTINRWDSKTKQLLERGTIALTDIVPTVDAVFEDTTNNQLIYWSGELLYNQTVNSKSQSPNKSQ